MVPQYKPRQRFDAELVYQTWLTLVAEESLYDSLLEGRHQAVAARLGLSAEQVLILDDFACQPGTKWHVENLRFRCATMVGRLLTWHLPGTIQLLTNGCTDWLRDLSYEYMAHSRWQDYGHHQRAAECERFARFVRQRIMKRRPPPMYLEAVLDYELALLSLQQLAGRLSLADWPSRPGPDEALDPLRPCRPQVVTLYTLPADFLGWLGRPAGSLRIESPDPVAVLLVVPSPEGMCTSIRLDADGHRLFLACDGQKTVAELTAAAPRHLELLTSWFALGALSIAK